MKRITPDLQATLTNKFVSELAFLRKFKRYWQTEVIDGVEVFKSRNYYYPADRFEESTKKLAKLLGMYDKLQGKQEGVKNAWLYFNPKKAPDVRIEPSYGIYARNFNKALEGITSGTVTISSKVLGKNDYESAPIETSVSNQEGLIAEIQSKFSTLWSTDFTVYGGSVDDYQALFFMYLLRSSDVVYEITKVEKVTAPITYPTGWDETTVRVSTQPAWRVHFTFTPMEILETTDVVLMLSEDAIEQETTAAMQVGSHLSSSSGNVEEGEEYTVYEPTEIRASDFWYIRIDTSSGVPKIEQYLRTNILSTDTLTRQERIKYITTCLDTGYRKKSAKWYEVVIAIVVIVVVTIYSAGTGTAAAAAAWGGTVALAAAAITIAAFIITVISYALGAAGLTRMAGVMGEFLKTIEPLVRVASVITIIGSFVTIWREATARAAASTALSTSAQATVTEVALETGRMLIERITGFTSFANMQMSHVMKMVEFTFGQYQSEQTDKMEKMLKNERAELARYAEMDEQSKTSDILKDFALVYPDLLSRDHAEYANRYDRPYEWWSTPYHTGCIQATTVNALWLSKS